MLAQRLTPFSGKPELCGSLFTSDWLDDAWSRTDILPPFAVQMYQESRNSIHAALGQQNADPVSEAIAILNRISLENMEPALPL